MGARESKPNPTASRVGVVMSATPQSAALMNDPPTRHAPRAPPPLTQQQQPPQAAVDAPVTFPVVIRYKAPDVKARMAEGQPLQLVTAHHAKPLPMSKSEDNYYAIVDLPPGDNTVCFSSGGSTFVDTNQPVVRRGNEDVNVVRVSEALLHGREDDDVIDDAAGWGQEAVFFEETRKFPPMLPPHLRYTPLNAPPTQVRYGDDSSILNTTEGATLDPEHLPLPLSVTINHVYFQRRDDHTVTGITTRFRDRFTTTAYYRPSAPPHQGSASAPIRV